MMRFLSKVLICILLVPMLTVQANTFGDVRTSDWFSQYVDNLADQGIISTTNANFYPNRSLSRAELAKMIVLAASQQGKLSIRARDELIFCDVLSGDWAKPYVDTLAVSNIVTGTAAGCPQGRKFFPNNPVSRAEALKMLLGSYGIPNNAGTVSRFFDVDSNIWYSSYIATAVNMGLVTGYSDGSFHPNYMLTRAEMSKILSKLMDIYSTDDDSNDDEDEEDEDDEDDNDDTQPTTSQPTTSQPTT
ncbi:S-layer homology domain-containing protein, partial [Candidatus Gracilibacteria bacterium]|nr:S-layer homology domain-containing protein [Candidatus Gracilibacteria bacterium]